jgi:hypothetical protein
MKKDSRSRQNDVVLKRNPTLSLKDQGDRALARVSLRFSDEIRLKMQADLSPKKAKARQLALESSPHPRVLRALMASGHMDRMGNKRLMKPFEVIRTLYVNGFITGAASVGVGAAKNIQLDELPGFTDFTALFDQYRFTNVNYKFLPRNNIQSLTTTAVAGTSILPVIMVASDPDDSIAPSSVDDLTQYEGVQIRNGYEIVRGDFKPYAAIAAYGGAFSQFASFDGWVDCAYDDTEWYALKAWITPSGAAQSTFQAWNLALRITCEFRFVH